MSQCAARYVAGRIRHACQLAPPSFACAAPSAANRRWNACNGVSPGKMSEDGWSGAPLVVSGGDSVSAGSALVTAAGKVVVVRSACAATSEIVIEPAAIEPHPHLAPPGWLVPELRLSHCRRASSEISTPRPRRPVQRTATDSPARRSRSNSSRCGSSCIVFGCFGQRACATNSARVGVAVGAVSSRNGGVKGVMLELYSERLRSAMEWFWISLSREAWTLVSLPLLFFGFCESVRFVEALAFGEAFDLVVG